MRTTPKGHGPTAVSRSWKARLGGQDVAVPCAAIFGTDNGIPSANVELVPPAAVRQLKQGDFVEAEVELLVVPTDVQDYYGPNEPLRADLKANANTYKPIHRLARGNDIEVHVDKGVLQRTYPPAIAVDANGEAVFTLTGGVGYVPITVAGLHAYKGYSLTCDNKPVDQTRHGNDFWQTVHDATNGTWSLTYNV
jgi:hypothetical protein